MAKQPTKREKMAQMLEEQAVLKAEMAEEQSTAGRELRKALHAPAIDKLLALAKSVKNHAIQEETLDKTCDQIEAVITSFRKVLGMHFPDAAKKEPSANAGETES